MYYKSINTGALPLEPHFILFLDEKNEARKIKTKPLPPALLKDRNF